MSTKSELSRTFKVFESGWVNESVIRSKEEDWVDTWDSMLHEFDAECIRAVTNYVIASFHRSPMLSEFYKLCQRQANGQDLSEPIVSKAEEFAKQLIGILSEDNEDEDWMPDALMIAAAVLRTQQYTRSTLDLDSGLIECDFVGRMRMFAHECLNWKKDAENGKGYWVKELANKQNDSE